MRKTKTRNMNLSTEFSTESKTDEQGFNSESEKNEFLFRKAILGAETYEFMDIMYLKTYKERYREISSNVKYKHFNKLFLLLTKVDLADKETLKKATHILDEKVVLENLDKMMYYFQDLEEYEKCALIKKFSDTVKL